MLAAMKVGMFRASPGLRMAGFGMAVCATVFVGACDDEPTVSAAPTTEEAEPAVPAPEPGPPPIFALPQLSGNGARGRIGTIEVPAGRTLEVQADGCQQATVVVLRGTLSGLTSGQLRRALSPTSYTATEDSVVLVTLARIADTPFPSEGTTTPCGHEAPSPDEILDAPTAVEALPFAGGKLRVKILLEEASGALHGSLAHLDADADLSVPEHVHETSAEILFIEAGNGTMVMGEERFPIQAGQVYEVPPGVRHGYEAGTEALQAWQVYAPPGPEQRFRPTPPARFRRPMQGSPR